VKRLRQLIVEEMWAAKEAAKNISSRSRIGGLQGEDAVKARLIVARPVYRESGYGKNIQ
jgi:hypothetical protein